MNLSNLQILSALSIALCCVSSRLPAQTFTTLHSFDPVSPAPCPCPNNDGSGPTDLILWSNTLYGVAGRGGSGAAGTIFALRTDGTSFTTVYSFTALSGFPDFTNSDGVGPVGLILSGYTLYGTATEGGSSNYGTVFAVNTDGTSFTTLHSFSWGDIGGNNPNPGLTVSGNTPYGTTANGGATVAGTLFALKTDGSEFATLHSFLTTSTDGWEPLAGLVLAGNALYGTTVYSGNSRDACGRYRNGTVFTVNADGSGFSTLHGFTTPSCNNNSTNADGAYPNAGLILTGDTLYGTAPNGGTAGNGTVFKLNTNGMGFTTLHSFTGTNSDGAQPLAGLILSDNALYGTTRSGGSSGNGTVFKVNTDGTGFTTLHSFTALTYDPSSETSTNSDGAYPGAGLVLSGDTLYGTATGGGSGGSGTVFAIALPPAPPQLTIAIAATNVLLAWPTNATGFTLQSTTNLASPAMWTTVPTLPVVMNGQNTVTDLLSGPQQFYRLVQCGLCP